jgi:MYXO-CTERM domain-containing protein
MPRFALAVAAALWAAAPAAAGFQLRFADAAGNLTPTLGPVAVDETIVVGVYLVEDAGGSVLSVDGLFSVGVLVDFSAGGGKATVGSAADVAANPGFDTAVAVVGPTTAELGAVAFLVDPVVADPATPDRVFVGTFRFTGREVGDVVLTAGNPGLPDQTISGAFVVLDPEIRPGTATLTVTAVPVPAPAGLPLALVGVAGLWAARRRP